MKVINFILLALLAALHYALWFGDKSVFDLYLLRQTESAISQANIKLTVENDRMLAEVIDLKEGGETLETLARSHLGLIKKGETFYQIIE